MSSGGGPHAGRALGGPRAWQAWVALVAVGLYARTLAFGWTFDDQMEVVRNTFVHSWDHLGRILTTTVWTGSGMETYLYRPLPLLTYVLNHAVSGLEAWSYHLVNILLHAGVSVLVFRLGRLWRLPVLAAGIGALAFAVHPLHVEVVANVAGRKDLLAAGFVQGMVLSHRTAVSRGGWRLAVPPALFGLAMLSKEVGIMGLALVLAQDLFLETDRRRFFDRARVMGLYFGYLAALAAFFLLRVRVTGVLGVPDTFLFDNPLVDASGPVRVATSLMVLAMGWRLHVLPAPLSPDYSFNAIPVVDSAVDPRFLAALAALALVAWLATRPPARATLAPMALAWYLLAVLPASSLVVPVGTIFGERLLYLPSVAVCLVAGAGVLWLVRRRSGAATVGASLAVALLSAQTLRYVGAWRDDVTLFGWAVTSVPESTKAHHKLGEELLRTGDLGGALRSLNQAVRIAPDNQFAIATLNQAVREVAEQYGSAVSAADPASPISEDPDILHVLGQMGRARGELEEAMGHWEAALRADASHAPTLGDLGAARLERADTMGAIELLRRAVQEDPSQAAAWFNLARVHLSRGSAREAERALGRFISAAGDRYPDQVRWAEARLRQLPSR
jgi:tetratricopeptide (TPR) repeat protein